MLNMVFVKVSLDETVFEAIFLSLTWYLRARLAAILILYVVFSRAGWIQRSVQRSKRDSAPFLRPYQLFNTDFPMCVSSRSVNLK